jgi:hypothetical protein
MELIDYKNRIKEKYRAISHKICVGVKITALMKLDSNKKDKYFDYLYELRVDSLGIKLCYLDIEQLKAIFVGKPDEPSGEEKEKNRNRKAEKQPIINPSNH